MLAARRKRYLKPLAITVVLLLAIAGAVLLREYILLRRIAESFAQPKSGTPQNSTREEEKPAAKVSETTPLVLLVKRSPTGNRVDARVSFKAFKRLVEANPRLAHSWGRIGWKVLGDVPALCLRQVAPQTAFTTLGVQSGDCVTHIDGETVNQPLRNLGIWVTLGSRRQLTVDTLRQGRRITYHLTSN